MKETATIEPKSSHAMIINGAHELRTKARGNLQWLVSVFPPGEVDDENITLNLDIDDTILIELIQNWAVHRRTIMGYLGMI